MSNDQDQQQWMMVDEGLVPDKKEKHVYDLLMIPYWECFLIFLRVFTKQTIEDQMEDDPQLHQN